MSTIVTTQAINIGIQECKNLSTFLENDVVELMSEVEKLAQSQQDQNFDAFKEAILPRKTKLEELSKAMRELSIFLEKDFKPYIEEYIKTGKQNQDIHFGK